VFFSGLQKLRYTRAITGFAIFLCLLFFVAYAVLSITRHQHYQSFGYDLGINNQVVWRYSTFQLPITTSDPFPEKSKLATHIELVYALIAPFYWLWSSARMLLLVDALITCSAGIAVYLLAKKRNIHPIISLSLVIGFLGFYGVQNAMWFDVHSASFAAAFLLWFLYFLDARRYFAAMLFFFLAITAKENIALLTFLISIVYFLGRRTRESFAFAVVSLLYLLFVYLIFFPYIMQNAYLYQNSHGLLSNLNPHSLTDTAEKREAIFYSFAAFGFLPLLSVTLLIPIIGDFLTYFVLASELTAAHGIYMHYRITLAPLLVWATILTISRIKRLNHPYTALYLLFCTLLVQYLLHLPLSYLTKSWFWSKPAGAVHIEKLKTALSATDAVVAQNNIIPHISQRDKIYTLYPQKKEFPTHSPCNEKICDWFRWDGNPDYLFVDASEDWDARHLLIDRTQFISGIENLQRAGIIKPDRQSGSATLYRIMAHP
jgi:uncharacterized membrane protein